MASAAALDAADGVMDGRHFGRPIVQAGAQPFYGGHFGGGQFVQAAPAFSQYPQFAGATFAQPQMFGSPYFGGVSSTAAALDAADGVIDGAHFGRPIVQSASPSYFPGQAYYGGASVFGAQPQVFGSPYFGGASSTAAALDAADGVIDGRHFGRPIVQSGGMVPYTGVQQMATLAAPSFAAAPVSYGVPAASYFPGQRFAGGYGVPAYGQTYAGVPHGGFSGVPVAQYGRPFGGYHHGSQAQRAAALDAADGVMDGRHFGRPIVQRR